MDTFAKLTGFLSDNIYTFILIPLLLGVGIYYTIKLKCGQFTHIKHACKLITEPAKVDAEGEKGISPLQFQLLHI